jgi:hypothetical protein
MTTSALNPSLAPSLLGRFLAQPIDNPDFRITPEQLALDLERMRATPVVPQRPVLVLAGYHAWRLTVAHTASKIHGLVGGPAENFHAIAYPFSSNIDAMARRVVAGVERIWPNSGSGERHRTTEIDVVGISMGGIVARVAANLHLENGQKRLRIARLFTLATPHRGAILAERLRPDRAARDLHPDSPFLERLNATLPTAKYDLTCYARLNDTWVGSTRAAPPGREPIWVSGIRFLSHITISTDGRILADIARRLRAEPPLALRGSTPPCD